MKFAHLTVLVLAATVASSLQAFAEDAKSAQQPTTKPSSDEPAAVKKINLAQFEEMRADKKNVVLDVRTPKEFAAGHMPGAVNIDWHARDFADKVAKLDKSKTYLIHCQAGVRSASACKKMSSMDFPHLYDFSGGWAAYEKAGKPVEK